MNKLTIEAFRKEDFKDSVGTMTVQFNPDKLSLSWGSVKMQGSKGGKDKKDKKMADGSHSEVKVTELPKGTVNFNLIFDDTLSTVGKPIHAQVEKLKDLCLHVDAEVHATNYIVLTWGTFIFKCQMTGLSVDYVLFMPDGTPLRADVKCTFQEFEDALSKAKREGKNSPDMTRVVTVKEGDTLPLLCFRHYGSSRHYLKVARVNGLASPSLLRPGQRIVFPPLVDDIEEYYAEERAEMS